MSPVRSVLMHPNYDPNTRDSDIAIIATENFFNSTRFLRPFCPLKGVPPQAKLPSCYGLGWGEMYENGPTSNLSKHTESGSCIYHLRLTSGDDLQVTQLQPLSQYECSHGVPAIRNPKNISITDHMMCAGSTDGTNGTCTVL